MNGVFWVLRTGAPWRGLPYRKRNEIERFFNKLNSSAASPIDPISSAPPSSLSSSWPACEFRDAN
jgi:transposase